MKYFHSLKYSINLNLWPLVAVPSTYSKTYEKDLIKHGFKMVVMPINS